MGASNLLLQDRYLLPTIVVLIVATAVGIFGNILVMFTVARKKMLQDTESIFLSPSFYFYVFCIVHMFLSCFFIFFVSFFYDKKIQLINKFSRTKRRQCKRNHVKNSM